MSDSWKEITIDVEPRGKEFRIGLDPEATVADIISAIEGRCQEEGLDIEGWAKRQVGHDFQFVLMRKSEGNSVLAPGTPLSEVSPEILPNEKFKLGAQPVVGALPVQIFNRRIETLVDEFYESALGDVYRAEGWTLGAVEKKTTPGSTSATG